jgi:hypothetical protein
MMEINDDSKTFAERPTTVRPEPTAAQATVRLLLTLVFLTAGVLGPHLGLMRRR